MSKGRLEGFFDAILAIIMTIMVLEIKTPKTPDVGSWAELIVPLIAFLISFFSLSTLWYSHHELLKNVHNISYRSVLLNIVLLAWVSLVPVVTAWVAEFPTHPWPERFFAIETLGWILLLELLIRSIKADNPGIDVSVTAFAWWSFSAIMVVIIFPFPYSGLAIAAVLGVRIPSIWLGQARRARKQ